MRTINWNYLRFLLLACICGNVLSQEYPNRPIQVLVGFPVGGSADIIARQVIQKVSEVIGKPLIVENRTGAGGNIAFLAVANANPDGYSLLFSTPGIAINPHLYKKISYKIEDFIPIILIGEAPLVLLVNSSLPIKSINDLIKASKVKVDAIRFASAGNGSSSHLSMEMLKSYSGLQYLHVPYRGGGGPAIIDVMSGQVDITMIPISGSNMRYIRDPRLRPIGQTGSKRSSSITDIPTIEESGVKEYSSTTWYMILAPANTPNNIIQYLEVSISRAIKTPELQEQLSNNGVTVINGGPNEANKLLQSEYKRWTKLISLSGATLD